MRNRFPGPCKDCGLRVEAGAGYFEKKRGAGWHVRHVHCTAVARANGGKPLSFHQRQALHEKAMDMAFPFGSEDDIGGWG